MFDIEKHIDAVKVLDFTWEKVKMGHQWQSTIWDEDVKLVFTPDKTSVHQGEISEDRTCWQCLTTRVMFYSKDKKFYLIGVQLLSPVSK
jgi:hypothetical protein